MSTKIKRIFIYQSAIFIAFAFVIFPAIYRIKYGTWP